MSIFLSIPQSSPSDTLEVSSSWDTGISCNTTSSTASPYFAFRYNSQLKSFIQWNTTSAAQDYLNINSYNNGNIVLEGGNIGIKTTAPSSLLDICGNTLTFGSDGSIDGSRTNSTSKVASLVCPHYTNSEEKVLGLRIYNSSLENALYIGGNDPLSYNAATSINFFTASNTTTLGGSNRMCISSSGNVGIGNFYSPLYKLHVDGTAAATSFYETSDERKKTNICNILEPIKKLNSLRGVTFNWKNPCEHLSGKKIGFIAQEVEKVIPEVVTVDNNGDYAMQYGPITALLVEAAKEQQKQIEKLQESKSSAAVFTKDDKSGLKMEWLENVNSFVMHPMTAPEEAGLTIKENGFVGFGTENPVAVAHVKGNYKETHAVDTAAGFVVENTEPGIASQIAFKAANTEGKDVLHTSAIAKVGAISSCTNEQVSSELVFSTQQDTEFSEKLRIDGYGNVGIGTDSPTSRLDINSDSLRVRISKTPEKSDSPGKKGEIAWDANFIYICVAENTWKRTALASW